MTERTKDFSMKTLSFFINAIFCFSALAISAQSPVTSHQPTLYGNVFNQDGEPLIGATIVWDETTTGTTADVNGDFWLPKMDTTAFLLITYVGYDPVYIEMFPEEDTAYIQVDGITDLAEIEVTAQGTDNFTSTLDPLNLEKIGRPELEKAACCSLAESFETNGAVDVMQNDAVTSAKEVQMLGLRGIYTQLLMEKRPTYIGQAWPLGLEFIPGTWVQGIQISKGASSVQSGPQSVAGQINVELMKPWQDKPVYANLFGSTVGRAEANVHLNHEWNHEWSSGALLHGSTTQGEFDRNGDTFLDQPTKRSLNGLFRSFYRAPKVRSQINLQLISDEREGGQVLPSGNFDPNDFYRISQKNERAELFGKVAYLGFAKPATSLALIYGGSRHTTANRFGHNDFDGEQRSAYAQLLYATILGTTDHKLNLGASLQHDDYEERLNEANFDRVETMPGVYAEYTLDGEGRKFGLIAGLRADHLNGHGTFVTPRLNLKYNFSDNAIVRASAGRGVRSAQIISENLSLLASHHVITVLEDLALEDAWTFGLNYTQNFSFLGKNASVVADLYRTEFQNQVMVDMESTHGKALFYNLNGESFSNSLLLFATWAPAKGLGLKLAYKYNDNQATFNPPGYAAVNERQQRPLTVVHRGLVAVDYETPSENWMFNVSTQFVGPQRFISAIHLPPNFAEREDFTGESPAYALVNAQVTRRFNQFEVYVGGENLSNFTQENAIVDWQNPFGEYFNAMQVWGPLVGARGYVGVRMWLEKP